jgi:N-acylglucosamine-6-phosphate 2-epimerase
MMKSLLLPQNSWFSSLQGNLIVSCQALVSEPLFGAAIMAKMALAAKLGGAVAIRANSPADIQAIRAMVDLPIFGLYKDNLTGYEVYITPTLKHAQEIYAAGADVVCIDATSRPRPENLPLDQYIQKIKESTHCPVMADISTYEEGLQAEAAGADIISTTLSGYTAYSPKQEGPDFELIGQLAKDLQHPLLAEGRITTPEMAKEALNLGAYAVIVGGAITRPAEITARFVKGMNR